MANHPSREDECLVFAKHGRTVHVSATVQGKQLHSQLVWSEVRKDVRNGGCLHQSKGMGHILVGPPPKQKCIQTGTVYVRQREMRMNIVRSMGVTTGSHEYWPGSSLPSPPQIDSVTRHC